MEKLSATLTGRGTLSADLSGCGTLAAAISIPKAISVEEYAGPYEFTPGQDAQVVAIANKKATADITIAPVPQNYGLITWDGSTLTVS
jgi:hypothetical protein